MKAVEVQQQDVHTQYANQQNQQYDKAIQLARNNNKGYLKQQKVDVMKKPENSQQYIFKTTHFCGNNELDRTEHQDTKI